MTKKNAKRHNSNNSIAQNRKAKHYYLLTDIFEAGIVLEGWEVKSLRNGRLSLNEAYIFMYKGEAWLHGAHISPLLSASTHVQPDNVRRRKLLLHKVELNLLTGSVERKGYTIVPVSMYWKHGIAKIRIALAKGKKLHDKRVAEKDRDWARKKSLILHR